ncbi:alkaline phosphatase family protein [Agromyces intestinalis]|uniref:Alkaline phosphatase family protein n=1 Tax=Agromyces intestinalis TaxID=2592652 RepID=A0A5C1YCG0_9MICO|nr:nucleotide pyrophosphatase/phosphodiesterase family protein [Agromyces intestinalis]QEO13035.1 alkaline phosphatase family protein [Agromyces intestinalis]
MPAMLPVPDDTVLRPAAILPSVTAALAGEANPLGLPGARSAIVALVDGLGASNLASRAGHARHLAGRMSRRDVIRTVFPSTTAAAIASFSTGEPPGVHGIVGYRVLEPAADRVVNQLNGWDAGLLPDDWQRSATWFEQAVARGIRTVAVGAARYATSGFTRAVLRGAEYRAAATIADRVDAALELISGVQPTIVYLYIPELDQLAHSHGWESERWLAALETVDAELARLDRLVPRGTGTLVTADHGVVDVPAHRHVFVDDRPDLLDGVRHIAGEPRCLALHLDPSLPDASRARLIDGWRRAEEGRSWVLTRDEALTAGLYGPAARIPLEVRARIGDVLVAARSGIAYYDRRETNRTAEKMIGQHGSWTDEESRVPLIRGAAFLRD